MVLKYILDIVSADVNAIPDFTACGECLFTHKSTELNSEKRLEIKGFRVLRDNLTEPQNFTSLSVRKHING